MSVVETLQQHGICTVEKMLISEDREIKEFLKDRPRYDGHVAQDLRPVHADSTVWCWHMHDVLRAPHFLEFALQFNDVAEEYLQQEPVLYSLNAFTTFPSNKPLSKDIQELHRDRDDVRFLALFMYHDTYVLTEQDGPHKFMLGSHGGRTPQRPQVATIYGHPGCAFLADTSGLHYGARPTGLRSRSILWARWGVSDPPASYTWDKLSPIPAEELGTRFTALDARTRRIVRLVVKP